MSGSHITENEPVHPLHVTRSMYGMSCAVMDTSTVVSRQDNMEFDTYSCLIVFIHIPVVKFRAISAKFKKIEKLQNSANKFEIDNKQINK